MPEHGNAARTANSGRGIHPILGFTDVANAAARVAITQVAADKGRVVHQTGGEVPGYYVADGTGVWTYLDIGGSPVVTPTSLAANANDYQPTNLQAWKYGRFFRQASSVNVRITGFVMPATEPYTMRQFVNINAAGGSTITLGHEDVLSAAGNRIFIAGASDLVLPPGGVATLWPDITTSRWRVA